VRYRVSLRTNPCVERAYACQARACTGAEGFIHSEESVYEVQQKILWHSRMPTVGCQALSAVAKAFPDTFRFSLDTVLPSCVRQSPDSLDFAVGSLNCALSSAKEKGNDAEVLNHYLFSHHLTQRVKVLYSDNACEHLSHALDAFLFDMMIDQRFSVVDSQHQNGLSENVGWNILGPVRHDMDISNPSKGFRRACLRLNVERRACTPRAQLNWKSPF
jgi:hypothetical protein